SAHCASRRVFLVIDHDAGRSRCSAGSSRHRAAMTRLSGSEAQLSTRSSRSRARLSPMTSEAACRTGADFIRRRGDHIVEALMDGVPVAQAKEDLGALLGRERGGKTRLALQLGPLDEAKYAGLVDVRVIAFLERAARQHSSDAEGNAHL